MPRGASSLRMEYFYREQRKRHEVLMDADGQPLGGEWNFDADNRESFGAAGPGTCRRVAASSPTRSRAR